MYLFPQQGCCSCGTSCVDAGGVGVIQRDKIMMPKTPVFCKCTQRRSSLSRVYNPQRELALSVGACVCI